MVANYPSHYYRFVPCISSGDGIDMKTARERGETRDRIPRCTNDTGLKHGIMVAIAVVGIVDNMVHRAVFVMLYIHMSY